MNNVNFRKAIAYGINPATSCPRSTTARRGGPPDGLLPTLNSYIDQSMVN